jgi:hypothetical protein
MKEITQIDIDPNKEVTFYYDRGKAIRGGLPAMAAFILLCLFAWLLISLDDGTSANYRRNTMFILLGVVLYSGLIIYKLIAVFDKRPQMNISVEGISFYKTVSGTRNPVLYKWSEITELELIKEVGKGTLLTQDRYKIQFYHPSNKYMPVSKRVSFFNLRCADFPDIIGKYRELYYEKSVLDTAKSVKAAMNKA